MAKRLGQLLVDDGLISAQQVEEGLEHQVVHGGRLGTNLVELLSIELDALAEALGRQHNMACVLEQHFKSRDPRVAEFLSADLAARWHTVPLGLVGEQRDTMLVASTDPLPADGRSELEQIFGLPLLVAVAPELRLLYYLEQLYGIERTNRFKRVDASGTADFDHEPSDPERRRYVRTLSDVEPIEPPSHLARIAVRKVAVPVSGEIELDAEDGDLDDLLRAIRNATGRERIARLTSVALEDRIGDHIDAGMLLVIRDSVAIGWRGFSRYCDHSIIEAVAVPLGQPSCFHDPFHLSTSHIGPPAPDVALDRRMWEVLGTPPPVEIAVFPIAVAKRIVALLYAQSGQPIMAEQAGGLGELAVAVGAGILRLIKAAQR